MKPLPFKLWIQVCALGPLVFAMLLAGVLLQSRLLLYTGQAILLTLGLTGAFLGILLVLKRLWFTCPFCARPARAIGGNHQCLLIDCAECGMVSGTYSRFPPLTYRIEKVEAS